MFHNLIDKRLVLAATSAALGDADPCVVSFEVAKAERLAVDRGRPGSTLDVERRDGSTEIHHLRFVGNVEVDLTAAVVFDDAVHLNVDVEAVCLRPVLKRKGVLVP